jgi:hypothetical protein
MSVKRRQLKCDLEFLIITAVLLWIGWELHGIAKLAMNFTSGSEEGNLHRRQEIEEGK